jgi:two-component system LytT family response regulator
MKIRALIVDDEPPARELIATLLRDEPDVEVVGECPNGRSAVDAIKRLAPDLVFLDIQMPGLDGFGALAELTPDRWPLIIFVTAFDRHALRAFEVHAIDYLLKPFEYERLRAAVGRAREQLTHRQGAARQEKLISLLEDLRGHERDWDRIAIRESNGVVFVKLEEIDWIEADGNYLRLHAGKRTHLLRETMNSADERLSGKKFLRISRSVLVNLERVKEWQPMFHGDSVVILEDRTRLTVSRVYREKLDALMARMS